MADEKAIVVACISWEFCALGEKKRKNAMWPFDKDSLRHTVTAIYKNLRKITVKDLAVCVKVVHGSSFVTFRRRLNFFYSDSLSAVGGVKAEEDSEW